MQSAIVTTASTLKGLTNAGNIRSRSLEPSLARRLKAAIRPPKQSSSRA